jgi:serine protease Do
MKIIIFIFLFITSFQTSKSQSLSPDRVNKIKTATVRITIDSSMAIGTGFFINNGGLVATCFHVIQPSIQPDGRLRKIFVELNTGEIIEYGIISKIVTNWFKNALSFDYCLIAPVNPKSSRVFSFLKIGNFDSAKEGEEIYTCGYPIGIKQQFLTKGIISTKYVEDSNKVYYMNRAFFAPRNQALLDMTLNRGNSGGAIIKIGATINEDEVIGIADFIITPVGSQSEQIIDLLLKASGGVTLSGIDPNFVFAQIFSIVSSLSIGVSGCVSINHLTSWLAKSN